MAVLQNQPLYPAKLDLSHPALAGSQAQIICFGTANGFLRNAGNLISQPTPGGTLASGTTDAGSALAFNGATTYLDFGTASIPTDEFTVLFGGIFDALSGVTGIVDCCNGSSNGWSLYTSGTDMYLSGNHYSGDLLASGWTTGTFYHGAARNKSGTGVAIFRNGAKISSGAFGLTGVSNPTNTFLLGQLRVSGPRFITGRLSYFYLIDRYLSDDLIISLQSNPWQLFESEDDSIDLVVAGSGITLLGAPSTQGNAAIAAGVTQTHMLAGASSAQGNAGSAVTISQEHALSVQASVQSNLGTVAAIAQDHNLSGANGSQENAAVSGTITQGTAFFGAACAQANAAGAGAVTQEHMLSGASGRQVNAAPAAAITQEHVLVAQASTQPNAGNTGVITLGVAHNLTAAAAVQQNSSVSGAIAQEHVLVHAPSVQDNIAATSVIVQSHLLTGSADHQTNACSGGVIFMDDGPHSDPRFISAASQRGSVSSSRPRGYTAGIID